MSATASQAKPDPAPVKWREYLDAVGRLENDGAVERSGEAIDRDVEIVRAWFEWADRQ